MPSANYKLFVRAMKEQKQIACIYDGHRRELCPHILGHNKEGEEAALAYQFGGETSRGPLQTAQWKCLRLELVNKAELREGEWHEGKRHSQRQHCVANVDLDVNPDSPYNPKRRLDELDRP